MPYFFYRFKCQSQNPRYLSRYLGFWSTSNLTDERVNKYLEHPRKTNLWTLN